MKTFILSDRRYLLALSKFLSANWEACANRGKPLQIAISEYSAARSAEQNRRYWSIIRAIADGAWVDGQQFSAEAWHEYLKRRFIGVEELPNGDIVAKSSAKLKVDEFGRYCDQVEAYAVSELAIDFSEAA